MGLIPPRTEANKYLDAFTEVQMAIEKKITEDDSPEWAIAYMFSDIAYTLRDILIEMKPGGEE